MLNLLPSKQFNIFQLIDKGENLLWRMYEGKTIFKLMGRDVVNKKNVLIQKIYNEISKFI